MSPRSVLRMGLFFATLWAVTAFGQEPQWTHDRRVNRASGRESDVLVIRGHYLTPLPPSHDEGTPNSYAVLFSRELGCDRHLDWRRNR